MTDRGVLEQIDKIEKAAKEGDDEKAACLERALWFDVLAHIASNSHDYGRLAELALITTRLDFYHGGGF